MFIEFILSFLAYSSYTCQLACKPGFACTCVTDKHAYSCKLSCTRLVCTRVLCTRLAPHPSFVHMHAYNYYASEVKMCCVEYMLHVCLVKFKLILSCMHTVSTVMVKRTCLVNQSQLVNICINM